MNLVYNKPFVKMNVYQQWKFSVIIFSFFLSYVLSDSDVQQALVISSPEQDNYDVDPHSFHYDKSTKTDMRTKSSTFMVATILLENSYSHQCKQVYNDCVNDKKNDISDEFFSRQIINILLSRAGLKENDDGHKGNVIMELSTSQLEQLRNFANGKATIRDTYLIIPEIFKTNTKFDYEDIYSLITHLCMDAIIHKDIVIGSLVVLYMTYIILTTKWNMLKLCGITIMIILAASFIITWLQLLQEAEVKLTVKQMKYPKMPIHCQLDKMSLWDKIFSPPDSCQTYIEAQMENSFLHVTPAQALSHMIGTCIMQPLKLMGNILSDFSHQATKHLWFPIKIIIQPLLLLGTLLLVIILMYYVAGGSFRWALGPLSFFSLRRIGNASDNSYIKNDEKREPINVIFNLNMPGNSQSHQLSIETPTECDKPTITSIKAGKPENKLQNADTTSKIEELCSYNPASGDSNLLNSPLPLENNELKENSNMEKIEKESGSGDN